jgi:tetratricopeptide (TPR) repeat protein
MLRGFFLAIIMLAAAGPARAADDLELCRNRNPDAAQRQQACEKLIAAGQLSGKDLGLALWVRGAALLAKRETDKAIAAFGASLDADPENAPALVSRGYAHEGKGDDDLAMADYNRVLQKYPNAPLALNNRGTL